MEGFIKPAPREACGVFAIYNHPEAAKITYFGLYALQHRGQESAGITTSDGCTVRGYRGMGLVSEVFREETLSKLPGHLAIGHVRYSTTGSSILANAQPFLVHYGDDYYALAHNGNIINARTLRRRLEERGSIFQSTMDTEVIIHLMTPLLRTDLKGALIQVTAEIKGSYSLVILTGDKIIALRDPHGFRPLSLGRLGEGWVVSSETCAFDLVDAEYVRDIEPGEAIIISREGLESFLLSPQAPRAHCIFELIYFARPDSTVFGENVYLFRKRLGHQLAREYRPEVDLVMPFPDSGNYAALGYAEEGGIPFEMGMIRNHYVGRSFIQPTQSMRDFSVRVKLNPVQKVIAGKKILVIEDSIVRGTTSKSRVANLREAGAREIHMAVSCPPIRFPCPYGIDFSTSGELIAAEKEREGDIARFIGLDSLHYLSLEGMLRAGSLPAEDYCLACYKGRYLLSPPDELDKHCLEADRAGR